MQRQIPASFKRSNSQTEAPTALYILVYQQAFGHQFQSISVDALEEAEQQEQIIRFAEEVMPLVNKELAV
ncbi:hypothetical protein RG959_18875 [Domibacillus sp. 8LH]|uniref:hypothetical protein n=1 Tax=Domibacillus sp. 8LH TaxID=3073900 RepID=UPI0031723C83